MVVGVALVISIVVASVIGMCTRIVMDSVIGHNMCRGIGSVRWYCCGLMATCMVYVRVIGIDIVVGMCCVRAVVLRLVAVAHWYWCVVFVFRLVCGIDIVVCIAICRLLFLILGWLVCVSIVYVRFSAHCKSCMHARLVLAFVFVLVLLQ